MVVILDTYGTTFESGEPVTLQGFSDDIEDGSLPDGKFYWSDELGQIVGYGYNMQAELPVGQHKITLEVTDSDGQVGSASIDIIVQAGTADNGEGNGTGLPGINLPANSLYLLGGGACVLMLMGSLLVGGVFLLTRGRKQTRMPGAVGQAGTVQDQQGNWWVQDSGTGQWNFWNGRSWQAAQATAAIPPPPIPSPQSIKTASKGGTSCMLTLVVAGLAVLLAFGAVSVIGLNFIPGQTIQPAQNVTLTDILKMAGGGLLISLLGVLMLRGGIKSILTRRAVLEDEWGQRRVRSGCLAVLTGISQAFFGLLLLFAGSGLMALSLYQQVFPWLGIMGITLVL